MEKTWKDTMEIQPTKPAEAGALKLNYEGPLSFIDFDIGDREGFELIADYYPTIPQHGLRLYAMFDQSWNNRVRLVKQALAAAVGCRDFIWPCRPPVLGWAGPSFCYFTPRARVFD